MLLADPRLRFARDLVAHWTHIRQAGLVPFEEDIDPRALMPAMPFITITAVGQPSGVTLELVFPEISRRYGKDMRKADHFDHIPPQRRAAAEEAKRLFVSVPCGAYLHFAIWAGSVRIVEARRLSLPLCRRPETVPSLSISLSCDLDGKSLPDPAPGTPRRLERIFAEFVDIGAGAPPFPSG
jgi:hypothetical protein